MEKKIKTYFQRQIIIRWRDTRVLLQRVSLFKSSKSMAPPFRAAISSETSNREGFWECAEAFCHEVCRRQCLQYQLLRAPCIWVGNDVQLVAVVSRASVVWNNT